MKTKEQIAARIDGLDERYGGLSERTRMSADGLQLVLRMSELQWALE